jgi:hypothetical protein
MFITALSADDGSSLENTEGSEEQHLGSSEEIHEPPQQDAN